MRNWVGDWSVIRRIGITTAAVLAVDASTKWLAFHAGPHGATSGLIIPLTNRDLSLQVAAAPAALIVLVGFLGLALVAGFAFVLVLQGRCSTWVPGLLAGGALGNIADRALFGAVHDWLHLSLPGGFRFTINLADLAILIAATGYLLAVGRKPRESRRSRLALPSED